MIRFDFSRSPSVMYSYLVKVLRAVICVSALSWTCAYASPEASPRPVLLHGLFPLQSPRPCPCVVDGNSNVNMTKVAAVYSQVPNLSTTLLSPAYAKGHRMCQDFFTVFPHSWRQDQGVNASALSPSAARARQLTGELMAGCKETCAVVGNSIRLKGVGHGPEIDRADLVIRVNTAPVKGFEADVGSKSSIRLISPDNFRTYIANYAHGDPALRERLAPDIYAIRCLSRQCELMMRALEAYDLPEGEMRVSRKRTFKFMQYEVDRMVHFNKPALIPILRLMRAQGKPSTGAMAIVLSLMLCKNVHLYGFGDETYNKYGYYYKNYTGEDIPVVSKTAHVPKKLERHDIFDEWQFWKALADAGLIKRMP